VFTKSHTWQRWSGPHADLTAAITLASDDLYRWSGIPARVKIRTFYDNQLSEVSDDPLALEQIHSTDLHRINGLEVDVEEDSDWWLQRSHEYNGREIDLRRGGKIDEVAALDKPPALTSEFILLRLGARSGMRLAVQGLDRTRVEGLTSGLVNVLNRSATGPTNIPSGSTGFVLIFTLMPAIIAFNFALIVSHPAPLHGHYYWQLFIIPAGAALVVAALCVAFFWALPTVEILSSGERSRFQRYRAALYFWLVAIIAGVIATAIWAAIT
jgi:hypothetical protein